MKQIGFVGWELKGYKHTEIFFFSEIADDLWDPLIIQCTSYDSVFSKGTFQEVSGCQILLE